MFYTYPHDQVGGPLVCRSSTIRTAGAPRLLIDQSRLNEIPRPIPRASCLRRPRIVGIQKADAMRLYGPHTVWKDVGRRLLDGGC